MEKVESRSMSLRKNCSVSGIRGSMSIIVGSKNK